MHELKIVNFLPGAMEGGPMPVALSRRSVLSGGGAALALIAADGGLSAAHAAELSRAAENLLNQVKTEIENLAKDVRNAKAQRDPEPPKKKSKGKLTEARKKQQEAKAKAQKARKDVIRDFGTKEADEYADRLQKTKFSRVTETNIRSFIRRVDKKIETLDRKAKKLDKAAETRRKELDARKNRKRTKSETRQQEVLRREQAALRAESAFLKKVTGRLKSIRTKAGKLADQLHRDKVASLGRGPTLGGLTAGLFGSGAKSKTRTRRTRRQSVPTNVPVGPE